jgi:hypothetical protein
MFQIKNLLVLLLLFVSLHGFSQNAILKGKVTGENGKGLSDVQIYLESNSQKGTTSDTYGQYELTIPANKKLIIVFSHASFSPQKLSISLTENEVKVFDLLMASIELDTAEVTSERIFTIDALPNIDVTQIPNTTGVEGAIKLFGLGVTSNNEMSSTYNVRGGNFDENLIYVNDIEIYRPMLVRSGQQEGLSFINPDLVESIQFSSGGFEARYGDKLSSVLDIRYREPDSSAGTVSASLLGTTLHFEGESKNQRFNYISGFRYRSNAYVLNGLNTQGDYKPFFADGQVLMNFYVTEDWKISVLTHFSRNKYNFIPESRETDFGSINEALRLTVFFDGQEINEFNTSLAAITSEWKPNKKTVYKWISSVFKSNEDESYDIMGQFRLEELERDLGSDNFGEVAFLRGVGTYLNHARNRLDVLVYNSRFLAVHQINKGNKITWGVKYQGEIIRDTVSEWQMIDSAGFSIPQSGNDEVIRLNEPIKSSAELFTHRAEGFIQHDWKIAKETMVNYHDTILPRWKELNISSGIRGNYWSLNGQTVVSPRVRITYLPGWLKYKNGKVERRNIILRAATGVYYQPPFYRELRDLSGTRNYDLKAQRSIHFILGGDVYFKMWDRVFMYTTELYYKHLTSIVPYEIDNVRLRYYANNGAKGYSTGIDMRVNGEFIKGIQSFATLSILKTAENIDNDAYQVNYNSDGEVVVPGITQNDVVTSTETIEPGYIPRPADQRVNFTIFFQDEMPKWPEYKVHLSFIFGSGLPFGPPSYERYKDILRMPPYRRVDIGFSRQFLTHKEKLKENSKLKKLSDLWISLEVFNLLGIDNTISYLWIEDSQGLQYAVPNYLTSRRINLKLMVKF